MSVRKPCSLQNSAQEIELALPWFWILQFNAAKHFKQMLLVLHLSNNNAPDKFLGSSVADCSV